MAWNGSGTFARLYNWVTRAANPATKYIDPTSMDGEFDNFKVGLENCLTKTGETTPTANQPMGNFRHTGVGAAAALTDYARAGEVQKGTLFKAASPGGTVDAMTGTITPTPSLTAGQIISIIAPGSGPNTVTNPTATFNGGSALTIKKHQGALVAGDYTAGDQLLLLYDGTNLELLNPKYPVSVPTHSSFTTDATGGDTADLIPIVDASASNADIKTTVANFFKNALSSITAKSAPIAADTLMIADSAASGAAKISTVQQVFNVIASFTAKSAPILADTLPVADSAASNAVKASTIQQIFNAFNLLTQKTTPVSADKIPLADSAASGVAKYVAVSDLANAILIGCASAQQLVIKNNATTPNTKIDITASQAVLVNSSGKAISHSSISLTCDLGTTGANALDTGTIASSTWYYIWLISNGTTVACVGSTSSTAPTLPGGYTFKMYIGAMLTDGSSNLKRTLQKGANAQYKITAGSNTTGFPVLSAGVTGNVNVPTWTTIATGAFVPSTASHIKVNSCGGAANGVLAVSANNATGVYTSTTNPPHAAAIGDASNTKPLAPVEIMLETTDIYVACSISSVSLFCVGWTDGVTAS